MTSSVNLKLGYNNRTPYATLTSDPSPMTPLDYIKNEYPSRQTIWDKPNFDGNIVIRGTMSTPQYSSFIALPKVKDIGDIELQLALYLSPDVALDILAMPFTQVRKNKLDHAIPLGQWVVGVDEYGVTIPGDLGLIPDTFIYWFDQRIFYDSFKLTIRRSADSSEPLGKSKMRMLYMGDSLQLENNFSHGNSIKFLSPPKLIQTAGGSWINTRRQLRSRTIKLGLNQMTGNDFNALQQLESVLLGEPFIVSAFPTSAETYLYNNYTMLARFSDEIDFAQQYQHHRANMTFLEV